MFGLLLCYIFCFIIFIVLGIILYFVFLMDMVTHSDNRKSKQLRLRILYPMIGVFLLLFIAIISIRLC